MHDYREANLSPRERALCDFAVKLTTSPPRSTRPTSRPCARKGCRTPRSRDAIQVIGYFNYVTRVADGVGIDDEPEWRLGPAE